VFLYFHGNTGTRALDHRKEIYWLLQNQDFHVIAFDYRGFADSTRTQLSEESTVADGLAVYKWIRGIIGTESQTEIFIWGHSLGTG
jgi:abhydrolase domain-containing protein 12